MTNQMSQLVLGVAFVAFSAVSVGCDSTADYHEYAHGIVENGEEATQEVEQDDVFRKSGNANWQPPPVCTEGVGPEKDSPWVVCSASSDIAWISANTEGIYDPLKICKELGYDAVSSWGGTCGNVCGYCEGPTSCTSPGLMIFDQVGGFFGKKFLLAYTVHWTCYNL